MGPSDLLTVHDSSPLRVTGADKKPNTVIDWTAQLPATDHIAFFRSTNWAATSLGALQTWSASLRRAIYMLLADCRPACIFW
jgi:hypothetical protein